MPPAPAPTLEEWRELYKQAKVFQEREPWNWLNDQQIVAVENPETKEVAYCSIMGAGGMEYGLVAYRGAAGLRAFALVVSDALDEDETLLVQDSLSFYLGDREMVFPQDREVHKALGLRFRGRGAWPICRTCRPGFLPAFPSGPEVRFLAVCLEQAYTLVQELLSGSPLPDVPDLPAESRFIARRRSKQGSWETTALPFPEPPPQSFREVDRLSLTRLRKKLRVVDLTWEAAVQVVGSIAGEETPYWGWLLLCVDQKSGFIWGVNVGGPQDTVPEQFFNTVQQAGLIPKEVQVTSGLLQSQLAPLAEPLGIKLRRVDRLRELERASKALKSRFR